MTFMTNVSQMHKFSLNTHFSSFYYGIRLDDFFRVMGVFAKMYLRISLIIQSRGILFFASFFTLEVKQGKSEELFCELFEKKRLLNYKTKFTVYKLIGRIR